MIKTSTEYHCIGLMSGTSLDGLDLVFCMFSNKNGQWKFRIEQAETIKYSTAWKKKLSNAIQLNALDLAKLDNEFGRFSGQQVKKFILKHKIKPSLIASHGHTVFHQPEKKLTLQIGNGAEIAAETKITTISNFRVLDVALGGQGAPLVPIGDKLLFGNYEFCLNLGGIANISYDEKGLRKAFDICPVNIVINSLVSSVGLDFDKDGTMAKKGKIDLKLLQKLNALDFYANKLPKSLGREYIETFFIPLINRNNIKLEDKLRTFYEHIAYQIATTIKNNKKSTVLITGGGAYNKFLIQLIQKKCSHSILVPDSTVIEFKEALIFAFLGVLRIRNEYNCLSSVTGAKSNCSGGVIYLAS